MVLLLIGCGGPPAEAPPPEEALPPECATGAIWDGTACVPEACGLPPWGDAGGDLYVDAAAPDGGDGSVDHPWNGLDPAFALDAPATVRVAAGRYAGSWSLDAGHDGLVIHGRCSDLVSVDADGADLQFDARLRQDQRVTLAGLSLGGAAEATLNVTRGTLVGTDLRLNDGGAVSIAAEGTGATLELTDVTATGSEAHPTTGLVLSDGATLTGTGLTFVRTRGRALLAEGGAVASVSELRVETVEAEDGYGMAIWATGGALVQVTGGSLVDATGVSVFATDGAEVTLTDSRVGPVVPTAQGGIGLWVQGDAVLRAEATVVEDTHTWGVIAADRATLGLRDVLVSRVGAGGGNHDAAVVAFDDATVEVEDLVLDTVSYTGIVADGGVVIGSDVSVSHLQRVGGVAAAAATMRGGVVELSGMRLDESWTTGFSAGDAGSRLDLDGVEAEVGDGTTLMTFGDGATGGCTGCSVGPVPMFAGVYTGAEAVFDGVYQAEGSGPFVASDGGRLSLLGSTVEGFSGVAVHAAGPGTSALVSDTTLRGRLDTPSVALAAQSGAVLTAEGVAIHETGLLGFATQYDDARIVASDTTVGAPGEVCSAGIQIAYDSGATFERVHFEGLRDVGILVTDPGSWAEVHDVEITGVVRTPAAAMGVGVVVQADATFDAEGLVVEGVEGPGVVTVGGARIGCTGCRITDTRFAGVVVSDATVSLLDSTVDGAGSDASLGGGVGIHAAAGDDGRGTLVVEGTEVGAGPYAGLWLVGDGSWVVRDAGVEGGRGATLAPGVVVHGNAVYAVGARPWDGARGLLVERSRLEDSRTAVLLDDASGTFTDVDWAGNEVDLQQQGCDGDPAPLDPAIAPVTRICPALDAITVTLPWAYTLPEVVVE